MGRNKDTLLRPNIFNFFWLDDHDKIEIVALALQSKKLQAVKKLYNLTQDEMKSGKYIGHEFQRVLYRCKLYVEKITEETKEYS